MKLFDCLPTEISDKVSSLKNIRELRIRNHRPVKVNVGGLWYYVGGSGLTQNIEKAIVLGEVCDRIVQVACNNSVYAYEKMLAKGFFTLQDGVRIGVCGHVAGSRETVFRTYTSLCLRIPHNVGCVDYATLIQCQKGNTVVIGPPCSGKTTFLRDLSVKLSKQYSVLVIDERGELFYDDDVLNACDCDVLKWSSKEYAFDIGVRAMSPDFIICDELADIDVGFVRSCVNSGVKIACSAHGYTLDDFADKFGVASYFATAIILSKENLSFSVKALKST
ncbi:MAG: hypothetical protein J1G02_03610 [Clostridiales bacterium]|nr:hypothetical protein [Clostridiales bacterium]